MDHRQARSRRARSLGTDPEKRALWAALLQQIPAPLVAVVDGHKGLESAPREHWPETKVRRCLFHIRQNIRTHLMMRPKLEAGKELLALAKALTHVTDLDQAAAWTGEFATWRPDQSAGGRNQRRAQTPSSKRTLRLKKAM